MDKPAAIAGSLVDVRNVGTRACVRLAIEVPAEQAPLVLAAFGWPTGAEPVPVAIARLNGAVAAPEPANDTPKAEKPRSYAQQAALMGNMPSFWKYLTEHALKDGSYVGDAEGAAMAIRRLCGVSSRRDLLAGTAAGRFFKDLKASYESWLMVPT